MTACSTTPRPTCGSCPTRWCSRPGPGRAWRCVLEVLGPDGSGVVVPRPSWEYDWFVERAGKHVVELPTRAPEFLPDPERVGPAARRRRHLRRSSSTTRTTRPAACTRGGSSRSSSGSPSKHRVYVLYDSVYQRLDYVGSFVNPAFANPEWRNWVVTLSGLSKMDMFGASTGARACWMVLSDQIRDGRRPGARGPREPLRVAGCDALDARAGLGARGPPEPAGGAAPAVALHARPARLHDRGGRRARPPRRRAHGLRRHVLLAARVPGPRRRVVRAAAQRRPRAGDRAGLGRRVRAPAGRRRRAASRSLPSPAATPASYGTWQRLSYGSRDVSELAVFIDRVRTCLERKGREGAGGGVPAHAPRRADRGRRLGRACTAAGYPALDALDPAAFAAARAQRSSSARRPTALRLTGTKHPDSTSASAAQLARAIDVRPRGRA